MSETETSRDWTAPRDPEALERLLRRFEGIASVAGDVPVMLSACPAWFDDVSFCDREVGMVGKEILSTAEGWWDDYGWEGGTQSAESRTALRARRLEKSVADVDPVHAPLLSALLDASAAGGDLCRDAVEAAVHPLESEEICAFFRPAGGGAILLLSHTMGWTDVAYGLSPDGDLQVWPVAGAENKAKEDRFPVVPSQESAVRIVRKQMA